MIFMNEGDDWITATRKQAQDDGSVQWQVRLGSEDGEAGWGYRTHEHRTAKQQCRTTIAPVWRIVRIA